MVGMHATERITFGDFQTPSWLASEACRLLHHFQLQPATIVEPMCGIGNFLLEASTAFPDAQRLLGADVNPDYVREAKRRFVTTDQRAGIIKADFFRTDWAGKLVELPEPILIVGNPPWVCNSRQGAIDGTNLPAKRNTNKARGIDALTGRSNFDVSEWMITYLIDAIEGRNATLAMLCKTSVARRVLKSAWESEKPIARAAMYGIDSQSAFGVAVDACLLVVEFQDQRKSVQECCVYDSLAAQSASCRIGFRDSRVIADAAHYDRWRFALRGSPRQWRSGIKHDCAKVMELRQEADQFRNGFNELVTLEPVYLCPLLKSSNLATEISITDSRWMLVPQQATGEDTATIRERAPRTWAYLQSHADRLQRRASSIYRGRPPFSVFGVGEYSFVPWKVAISGLYKQSRFVLVGPRSGKPVVFDDTCYFLPCRSKAEAVRFVEALNGEPAQQALASLIFWDAKRPITADVLNCLDIDALSQHLKEVA